MTARFASVKWEQLCLTEKRPKILYELQSLGNSQELGQFESKEVYLPFNTHLEEIFEIISM